MRFVIAGGVAALVASLASPLHADLPPDSAYVVVKDGHLTLNGERVRYWGAIGGFPGRGETVNGDKYAAQHVLLKRVKDLGFNMIRLWHNGRAMEGQNDRYTKGDTSGLDRVDYFLTLCQKEGIKIWASGTPAWRTVGPDDVKGVDGVETSAEWRKAFAELAKMDRKTKGAGVWLRGCMPTLWDPHLEALCIDAMKRYANHVNRHNGLRWGDDPVFAVWELVNEQWMMRKLVGGQWQKLPEYFRDGLFARWHAFLRDKYGNDEKLTAAWGELLPGESLTKGTILLAPLQKDAPAVHLNDANPHAAEVARGGANPYGPQDLPVARGRDVLEFFVGLHVSHKQRVAKAVKQFGKSLRLCPLVLDTGIGYQVQSQYLHQHGDAVTHCAYINGQYSHRPPVEGPFEDKQHEARATIQAERMESNRGKWINWLEKPPGICQDVPWLEHNRMAGKPFFCYETQTNQPSKYRADFPLRLGALAAIQDWDIACFHTMGGIKNVATDPRPFDRPMDMQNPQHGAQGFHYRYDELNCAMIRAAGYAFRNFAYKPAPNPTTFIYGRRALYDPASMRYAGSYGMRGMDMLQTTYQYGCRIKIDPTREEDEVIGPVVKFADRNTHNPYDPTDQIVFDWKKGYMRMDSPKAVAWTGLLAPYGGTVRFDAGVVLRNAEIRNAKGMYDPVSEDEKYLSFSLYSQDGKPLKQAERISCSVVSTSFNKDFELDTSGGRKHKRGTTPVLVARVEATVECPALNAMKYVLRDWHMRKIGEGTVKNGVLRIPADTPVFVVELTRP